MTSAPGRDDRKTAGIYREKATFLQNARVISDYRTGLKLLRDNSLLQDTPGAAEAKVRFKDPTHAPVIMLDGKPHRDKRKHVSGLFSPRYLKERYMPLMRKTADMLMADLERDGMMRVDDASWEMAVNMVGDIIGVTRGKTRAQVRRTAARIERVLASTNLPQLTGFRRLAGEVAKRLTFMDFMLRDLRTTIRERRKAPQDDLVSQLLEQGYSMEAILIDCLTYCGAGMQTTREFISMVVWQLLEHDDLRARYLASDEEMQFKILWEILRVDPIASTLYRKVPDEGSERNPDLEPGVTYAIDLRSANLDADVIGENPFTLDPDRADRINDQGAFLSFGNGMHRCPGSQLALAETRVFVDRLLRVPGIHLASKPEVGYVNHLSTIEVKNVLVRCGRA